MCNSDIHCVNIFLNRDLNLKVGDWAGASIGGSPSPCSYRLRHRIFAADGTDVPRSTGVNPSTDTFAFGTALDCMVPGHDPWPELQEPEDREEIKQRICEKRFPHVGDVPTLSNVMANAGMLSSFQWPKSSMRLRPREICTLHTLLPMKLIRKLRACALLALWEAFRGGESSISTPATNKRTSSPLIPEMDRSISPKIDTAPSDKPPSKVADRVQPPQPIDDRERNSASPTVLEGPPAEEEDISKAAFDIFAKPARSEGSTCDLAHSSHKAISQMPLPPKAVTATGPLTRRRQRRTRPGTRDSNRPSLPLTPWSSAHSMEVESTTAYVDTSDSKGETGCNEILELQRLSALPQRSLRQC